jgi:hypothetical protein
MGDRHRYLTYFEGHPGVYYRSPGWVEFQTPDLKLQPAFASQKNTLGEQSTLDDFIAKYGEDNGNYLFEQFSSFRRHYTGLTYISTGVASDDACRSQARAEAEKEGWTFDEVKGSLSLFERLVNGPWNAADFLVVPPGAQVRATLGDGIVEAI